MELTILMPCLNEAETLAICIRKAKKFLSENNIDGEVLISDNGSTDGSQDIAKAEGARVVSTDIKGYGSALINGTKNAYGKYVIMGDADDSYDFLHLMPFVEKLREGYDLVMGDRFAGGIEEGAMPWSHKYIGNPVLSFIGRLFYKSKIRDFHCGLRGYNRESMLNLHLQTTGMEYASEMVVKSELNGLKIAEVPTTLSKDGRSRPPHLRSFRDGWRHLKFLLMYAPNWLLLYPGFIFLILGLVLGGTIVVDKITINNINFSIHTLLYCACLIIIGLSILQMYLIVKAYAYNHNFLPKKQTDWNHKIREDRIIAIGAGIVILGIVLSIIAVETWKASSMGDLNAEQTMRIVIPAVLCLIVGFQSIFTGFIVGVMKIRTETSI
ncbi:MAG: glycosyltransferase family 2 protein [Clostridiales bacterium]|nr:glycosyltransferase family 2 protein [Clostridiales bacterium]